MNSNKCKNRLKKITWFKPCNEIKVLSLNRPTNANAYDQEMLCLLTKQLEAIEADSNIRVVIITGTGRNFCAGADLDELRNRKVEDVLTLKSREVFDFLAGMSKISIAAINGPAVGGGFEMALACDFRISITTATFEFPEINYGLIPAAGGVQRLIEIVGLAYAKELIILSRRIEVKEAIKRGIVNFTSEKYLGKAITVGKDIVKKDNYAIALTKKILATYSRDNKNMELTTQALLSEWRKKPI